MTSPNELTLSEARDALRKGDLTATDLTMACLTAMDAGDGLNAYVHKTPEIALEQARAADVRLKAGDAPDLCGIPLGIKDLFCTKGVPSQAASNILKGFRPEYESTVTQQLFDAGAVMLGKLNMDEFAMGSSNETSCYGNAINPWKVDDRNLTPGGSSGGSAAAVAADLCLAATGTDTGGSIRQPAAFTGITGIKPTYGRVSRWGIVAFASSLDQAGPFARDVTDAALLHAVLAGHDPRDATSDPTAPADVVAALGRGVAGLRIGVVEELEEAGCEPGVRAVFLAAIAALERMGAVVERVPLPHALYGLPAYYLVAPAEASSNLARFDGVRYGRRVDAPTAEAMNAATRAAGFGPEVRRRIMIGTHALSSGYVDAYYLQAARIRTLIARDFAAAFERVDVLVSPTAPSVAFRIGAVVDPLTMYRNDVATVPASLAGVPAVSVPIGTADDGGGSGPLPVGLQIMAPLRADDRCYRVAHALEAELAFDPDPAAHGAGVRA